MQITEYGVMIVSRPMYQANALSSIEVTELRILKDSKEQQTGMQNLDGSNRIWNGDRRQ